MNKKQESLPLGNKKITIRIDIAPTAQMRARATVRNEKAMVYKATKQRNNEMSILWLLRKFSPQIPLKGALKATLYCFMPLPKKVSKKNLELAKKGELYHIKKPDIDNLEKNIFDCMTKLRFYSDDAQICITNTVKKYCLNPRWEIVIEETDLQYL